ncbi:alpha/beta fold hydrolase [Salegentibacter flavus]|uniref:Pimeloyl-ACP methyl ester carboxylesterase n=1 Tax=Salegentibacter flavus TaxID=287099 RepID=A0A1I4XNX6_9FLAO|nr:alpha/beta fold hydrolase [Salegentibacter flavus]SFN27517.1 Pimeloyl-ACP methyl ester carboxylesterase [Salegentibacter flavus]
MKLHSNILGEGTPFLFLHGFLGMGDNWKTLGGQFAEAGYQVHLIDQRNHGKSPHSDDFDYEIMAEDVVDYCKQHNLSDIILLGHSMGGKAAMLVAAQNPDLVKKLIVVDIAPKYYAPHHQQILDGLTALEEAHLSSRKEAENLLKEFISNKGIRLFLLKNLERESQNKLCLKLNLSALKANIEKVGEALPEDQKYAGETLFIRGENSDYITSEDEVSIKNQFPKAEIISIPDAGHWVHAENSDAFYEAVLKFL